MNELAALIALLFFIGGLAVGYFMRGDHRDHFDGMRWPWSFDCVVG